MSEDNELKRWFSRQIKSNMDSLYFLALRLTGCRTRAEDLVAETTSKAWSNINKLQDHSRFRPWIFRILNNHFISEYRKQSGHPPETSYQELSTENDNNDEISCLLIQQSNEFLHWWANPEKEFCNQLLAEDIMNAIEDLPEAFRITVLLVNVEGFSYDEAALILDIPPGTIRSRMKRGRTMLQKALWQHAKDAGLVNPETAGETTT